MAVIGQIQKNSYLLLIVIGLAMLAFVFTDLFKTSGDDEQLPKGTLFGEEINERELNKLEEDFVLRDKKNFSFQGKDFTSKDEESSRDQAFNEYVRKEIMNKELELLDIQVTSSELNDMILGRHIHPWLEQISLFKNSLGVFSRDSVVKFIDNLSIEPDGLDTASYGRWREAKRQWADFEDELVDARRADKYVTLIKKGMYVNTLEGKEDYSSSKESRDISFVVQQYAQIPASDIDVTDEEIKTYYKAHKADKKFEQKIEAAEIEFVEFQVKFSPEDLERIAKEMEDLKKSFKNSDNDIYFMATKSDDKFFSDSTLFELGQDELSTVEGNYKYPKSADAMIQGCEEGDVVGPFASTIASTGDTKLVIAKVKGFEMQKQAWVRHILISSNTRSIEDAKILADSTMSVIREKDNFVEMVEEVSEDPGSKATGGEYKWFKQGQMVPEFDKASFEGAEGKLQLVKTDFGYHIVEVLGREERKLPILAPVTRLVKPGVNTRKEAQNIAYDFINAVGNVTEDSAFYKVANEHNLISNFSKLFINSAYVTGFDEGKKIKKFAFAKDAEEGDISEPIYDNGMLKVACLVNTIGKGVPNFEDVKSQMKIPALKEKQGSAYVDIMKGIQNLNEISSKVINGKVQTATVKFNSNYISGIGGTEAGVIGKVFALNKENEGAMLEPIKGEMGVYVIVLDKITEATETEDYVVEITALQSKRESSSDAAVIGALRKRADIVDNRQKIDAQGR